MLEGVLAWVVSLFFAFLSEPRVVLWGHEARIAVRTRVGWLLCIVIGMDGVRRVGRLGHVGLALLLVPRVLLALIVYVERVFV